MLTRDIVCTTIRDYVLRLFIHYPCSSRLSPEVIWKALDYRSIYHQKASKVGKRLRSTSAEINPLDDLSHPFLTPFLTSLPGYQDSRPCHHNYLT